MSSSSIKNIELASALTIENLGTYMFNWSKTCDNKYELKVYISNIMQLAEGAFKQDTTPSLNWPESF